jgi:hypothetical protein
VDRLVDAVRTLASTGTRSTYEDTSEGCQPTEDPRDLIAPQIW